MQMNFYHHQQRLVAVGYADDDFEYYGAGRREEFEIGEDERLIGCKFDSDNDDFVGVTWLKMKVAKF